MAIDRLLQAQHLLEKLRCDWMLVTDVVDVDYISGFSSSRALLLIGRAANHLYTDFRYQEAAERHCRKNKAWRFTLIKDNSFACLAEQLERGGRVAFQADVMTVDEHKKLCSAFPKARLIPVPGEISDLALAKTPAEIRFMRCAAGIGDEAFAGFCDCLKPGMTERDAASRLEALCAGLGSEKPSFDTIVLFGERSSLPHGHPGTRKLKRGDFVLADFGCTVSGFCSDMTRTVVFGAASKRQRELYAIVKEAHDVALESVRSGISTKSVDAVARSIIAKAGYGNAFGHGLGHGVGRRVHERPRLSPLSKETLLPGSVVTIEPGIYLPGFGGVRIEDMIVVQQHGSRLLTAAPSGLIEL